jgi:hypothetical protein
MDQVRKFIDRAETLISQAKQESAAYVAPQPAPAPVQPDVAPTPSPSDGSITPSSGLYGDFVLDGSSTGNEARFLAAYPTRPNDPLEARSYDVTLGLARASDASAISLQSMQDSMKNERRQVQPV